MHLPDALVKTLHDIHDDAQPWLDALPLTLDALQNRWTVRITGLAPQLSYTLVLYAEREDGTPCVLKLSPPSDELIREGDALEIYAGDGICTLLARDDKVSALLLERLEPGISLQETWTFEGDDTHTRIAARLMKRLWRVVDDVTPLRTLSSWARALSDEQPAVPKTMRVKAQALLADLEPDRDPVLLHADLHHGNILTVPGKRYLAIDPKGIIGARGYDIGTYLLNPIRATDAEKIALLPRRLALLSELLELETSELAAWGYVHAALSASWSAEDHGTWGLGALDVAKALEARL